MVIGIGWVKLTIVYTGSIYRGKQDPTKIMRALMEMIDAGDIKPLDIRVHFYGRGIDWLVDDIKKYDLEGIVMWHRVVSLEEALKQQRAASILLFLKWEDPKEDGVHTGKVFEYLAARRPILATGGHNDVVTQLLKETNAGIDCPSVDDIKRQLMVWMEEVGGSRIRKAQ